MKKATVLFLTIFTVAALYSQSYEIDFAGTGAGTVVDSVKVENLNQGISLILNGNDVLKLNIVTGIHCDESDNKSVQVYPNPMTDQAEIEFFVNESNDVLVTVYDISGRSVLQLNKFLDPGIHKFRVSGLYHGIYIVRINEQNSFYAAKLISQNRLNGEAEMEYVSSENIQFNQTQTKQLKATASTIEMPYKNHEWLKFTGMSGNYSTVVTDMPSNNKTLAFDFMDCTDADSNHYPVVKIGDLTWMAENLKYLPAVSPSSIGSNTEPYYYVYAYEDTIVSEAEVSSYYKTYGVLYNWPAAKGDTVNNNNNLGVVQGVCPSGWHLPNFYEWDDLLYFLGDYGVAGGRMKETKYWTLPNTGATNRSGFSALPSGVRSCCGEGFAHNLYNTLFWSSTEIDASITLAFLLQYSTEDIEYFFAIRSNGLCVRCVKDY